MNDRITNQRFHFFRTRVEAFFATTMSLTTWFALSLTLMLFAACAKPPETLTDVRPASTKTSTVDVSNNLPQQPAVVAGAPQWLLDKYVQLPSYRDETVMQMTYHFEDGRKETFTTTFQIQFSRPNRFRIHVASEDNQVKLVGDGTRIESRIMDPITSNFGGQVVLRDAAEKITLTDLYKATELVDPLTPDEMLSALMGAPAGLDMTTLSLLLGEGRLVELVANANLISESKTSQVYETSTPEGVYQISTDVGTKTLRRIVFPITNTDLPPGLARIELTIECRDVGTDVVDSDFGIDDQGVQVSHFVMPPLPPATEMLGKSLGTLEFSDAAGAPQNVATDKGEVTVITWFHDHPISRMVMEQLELVKARTERSGVRFLPVQLETAENVLKGWDIEASTSFDSKAIGRDVLQVTQAPATVVLGADNVVHYFDVGANPNIGNNVAVVVERLLGGQDVAADTLQVSQRARQAFQQQLALAKSGDGWVEQMEAELPTSSEPRTLLLKTSWQTTELAEPGNMLVVPGKKKQILITDGWNQLAVVDTSGKISRRIKLELPADDGITLLRAGKDKRDRALFAAATRGGRHAYVFDFGGKLLMQYPRIAGDHANVGDLAIGDMDGDGESELLVGWQGNLGVHAVSLEGKQLWTNRAMQGLVSVDLTNVDDANAAKAKRAAMLAGELGAVFLVDETGRTLREVGLEPRTVHQAFAWPGSARGFETIVGQTKTPDSDDVAARVCLSLAADGTVTAIGINSAWKPVWDYVLPVGTFRHQLDVVQSIDLPKTGATWLLAGPDGSVHFVSADGQARDSFYVGKHIRGIASFTAADKTSLLISTDGELTAWDVAEPTDDAK